MKKIIIGILVFFIVFYVHTFGKCQEAKGEEVVEVVQEVSAEVPQPSMLDQASDWWATLGKSKEEKTQILEERKLKRLEQGSQSTIEEVKSMVQEKASVVKETVKNRAMTMKEEAENKADALKQEVGQKVTNTKEQTAQKVAESKERVRQKVEETKANVINQVDTQKQKVKQESERTLQGFIGELFK